MKALRALKFSGCESLIKTGDLLATNVPVFIYLNFKTMDLLATNVQVFIYLNFKTMDLLGSNVQVFILLNFNIFRSQGLTGNFSNNI